MSNVAQDVGTVAPNVPLPKSEQVQKLAQALAGFLSNPNSRGALMRKIGSQYEGRRDIFKVAGYPKNLVFKQYWDLYTRGDIAGRIVDMQPQTTWRTPPEIVEPGMEEEKPTEFVTEFETLAKRLNLWSKFEQVDRLSGIGQYAVLLIGLPGEDRELTQEINVTVKGQGVVLYVQAYDQEHASIKTWVTKTSDPRFGQPSTYEINLSSGIDGFTAAKIEVHWSRIIHVAEDRLVDEVFGRPRLERVYNRLMDLEKVAASTGEAFWQLATRVLQAEVAEGAELSDQNRAKVMEQLEEIIHDLRRVFIGQDLNLEWLESKAPDPEHAADMYFTLIAGAVGIPKRMLFGSETGERASETDQRTYFGTINERQERHAEPNILRAFIDRLVQYKVLPIPGKDGYEVLWPTLIEESDKEKAEANKARAETARALTPVGGDPRELVEVDEDRNVWLKPTDGQTAKETVEDTTDELMEDTEGVESV